MRDGSLLVEAMLAIVVFGLFVGASYTTLLTGQEGTRNGSNRIRAINLNHQAIDAVRSIRNEDYDLLAPGNHGFTIDPDNGKWTLTGSSLERYGYTTVLKITELNDTVKRVEATTTWKFGYFRAGSVYLTTHISDWRTDVGVGDWGTVTQSGSWFSNKPSDFNDIYAYKNYLYLADNGSSVGSGLTILDISNASSLQIVSPSFSIPADVYTPIAYKDRLYVAVNNANDVREYNISLPTSLNSGTTPVAQVSLPGGGSRARSLAINDTVLLVGATGNGAEDELYAYSIQTGSTLTLLDSLDITGDPTVYDIFVRDNIAYLAAGTSQIISVDVSDPNNLSLLTMRLMGYQQSTGVRAYGTGYYMSMLNGTDEFSLRTGTGVAGVPSGEISDLYGKDLGNDANGFDMDHNGCYAFLATSNGSKEVQILDAKNLTMPVVANININSTGPARAAHYNIIADELYIATSSGVYIYSPGPSTSCQ